MIESIPYLLPTVCLLATVFFINKWLSYTSPNLDAIPAVGPTGRLTSFLKACQFLRSGHEMVQEGIRRYKHAAFRVPTMGDWIVVISKPNLVDEIRRARDEDLSLVDITDEDIQLQYAVGNDFVKSHYHNDVIRFHLARNLPSRSRDISDEIASAFNELIPLQSNEWVPVPVLDTIMQVACRTSNRFLVGLPLCRNPDYCDLIVKFTDNLFSTALALHATPRFLRPILGPLLSPLPGTLRRCKRHLEPLIAQRLEEDAKLGIHRPDRANDLISWLIDMAPEQEKHLPCYIKRVLFVNFSTIYTSSHVFTQILLQLAARPEYIQPLRDEVDAIITEEGWSKAALDKLRKIDSFIRECLRCEGLASLSMRRRVRKSSGFTFSDGTHLPQGTYVAAAAWDIHHNEDNYPKPFEFDGLRFFNKGEESGVWTAHQIVSTSVHYVPFGHGRHACPGRFFAASSLKAMLAHIVLTYDVKLDGESLPRTRWFSFAALVEKEARIMFRKRQA